MAALARVLCLHGLGGTAATMGPVADALRAAGHEVFAPMLPGHGTHPDGLLTATWAQWLATARSWQAQVVVGQSMGGSLALAVAAGGPAVAGVVAINAPPPDPDAIDGLEWQLGRGIEWIDGPPLAEGEAGYTRLPIVALLEMVNGALTIDLAQVTQPTLLVTSALDDVVDPFSADHLASLLPGAVTRVTLPRSGHVATLGPERVALADAIVKFAATVIGAQHA